MTTSSQSSVRAADEETVQALAENLLDRTWHEHFIEQVDMHRNHRYSAWCAICRGDVPALVRAFVESDPIQRLFRERQHGVETVWQLRGEGQRLADALHQAIRERDEARAAVARVEAVLADEWREEPPSFSYPEGRRLYRWPAGLRDQLRAALSGGASEQDKAEALQPPQPDDQDWRWYDGSGEEGDGWPTSEAEARKRGLLPPSIGDTCCGQCPGDTCYVDGVTGA